MTSSDQQAGGTRRTSGRRWLRVMSKVLHELASIGFGGGLAACLVLNLTADPGSQAAFAAGRHAVAAIARYMLLPSMAIAVLSGLVAMIVTRGYLNAGWAWVKAVLGLLVFQATLMLVGTGGEAASPNATPASLDALLRAERNTLWLLLAIAVVNVVLAVWRPRLVVTVR